MKPPRYWKRATRELAAVDPVMRKLIENSKGLTLRSRGDAFNTLARSIVGQQISVKAAQSVWDRLVAAVPAMHPEIVRTHDAEQLRACGLSRSKVVYLVDLATHFAEERLSVTRWDEMSDDELIAELTQVRGIGRWTAEMLLMFSLGRPDVLPVGDFGVFLSTGIFVCVLAAVLLVAAAVVEVLQDVPVVSGVPAREPVVCVGMKVFSYTVNPDVRPMRPSLY